MKKLLFLIKEGLAGFKRARLAAIITIISITFSLALIGIFGLLVQNLSDTFRNIYQQIHLEVFIDPSLTESQIQSLQNKIRLVEGVQTVDYISADAALQKFEKDFGEDLVSVLDANPLPPSLRVILKSGYSKLESIKGVVQQIESLEAVDDVLFQENIIRLLNKYFLVGVIIAVAMGATIFFISALLIFNTIRLTIHSRSTMIEIMRLVGATNSFIKAPFVFEGILQGLIGSLLASALLWFLGDVLRTLLVPHLVIPWIYFGLLAATGMILGLLGSYISVGKYLKF